MKICFNLSLWLCGVFFLLGAQGAPNYCQTGHEFVDYPTKEIKEKRNKKAVSSVKSSYNRRLKELRKERQDNNESGIKLPVLFSLEQLLLELRELLLDVSMDYEGSKGLVEEIVFELYSVVYWLKFALRSISLCAICLSVVGVFFLVKSL